MGNAFSAKNSQFSSEPCLWQGFFVQWTTNQEIKPLKRLACTHYLESG